MLPSNLKRQIFQHYNKLLNGLTFTKPYYIRLRKSILVCKKYLYYPECNRQCSYSILAMASYPKAPELCADEAKRGRKYQSRRILFLFTLMYTDLSYNLGGPQVVARRCLGL